MGGQKRYRKGNRVARVLNEPIRLHGAPQLIVTRGWAYAFWQRMGRPVATGRFDSADYLAFSGPTAWGEPLTDLNLPWAQRLLSALAGTEESEAVDGDR